MQDYIQQKRQQQDEIFTNEKRLKDEQEKGRKDKIKKLNEPIKDTSHQYLPSSLTKRTSAFTPVRLFICLHVVFSYFHRIDYTERFNRKNTSTSYSSTWPIYRLSY